MRGAGGMLAFAAVTGCGSFVVSPVPVPVSLLPLTVEQALPDDVAASDVVERDGCYYYQTETGLELIPTQPAPDLTLTPC